jgi:hypothetical protein
MNLKTIIEVSMHDYTRKGLPRNSTTKKLKDYSKKLEG